MYNQNEMTNEQLQKIKKESEDFLKIYGNKYQEGTMVKMSESDLVFYSKAGPMLVSRHSFLNNEIVDYHGFRPEDGAYISGNAITINQELDFYCHTHSRIYFPDGQGLETYSYGQPGSIHTPISNIGKYVENIVDLTKLENTSEETNLSAVEKTFGDEE